MSNAFAFGVFGDDFVWLMLFFSMLEVSKQECSKLVWITFWNYFWSSFSLGVLIYQGAFMVRLPWMDRVVFTVLYATIFCLNLIDVASRSA